MHRHCGDDNASKPAFQMSEPPKRTLETEASYDLSTSWICRTFEWAFHTLPEENLSRFEKLIEARKS
jgi:hypothetical protein